jgi:hypothetical protein
MKVLQAIADFGTEAVKEYSRICGCLFPNELPELFLGSFMAPRLHDRLGCNVHIERQYTSMAKELNSYRYEFEKLIGGCRSDLAIYCDDKPTAAIELKIFDEGGNINDIVIDFSRAGIISEDLNTYVGIMVCETPSLGLDYRLSALKCRLGADYFLAGLPQRSSDNKWSWCFASARRAPARNSLPLTTAASASAVADLWDHILSI